jgi:hypothetical protein
MPELVLFVSSAIAAGAKNKSADGSSFDIQFDTPLQMPSSTPTIRCLQATLFYSFPNITSANNGLRISWTTGTGLNVTSFSYQITFARGLYSVDDLNHVIRRELLSQDLAPDTMVLVADNATQTVGVQIRCPDTIGSFTAEFTHALSTINQLLKFTKDKSTTLALGERVLMADAEAEFAPCSSVLLHCSLASGSFINGAGAQDVIASIALDASPGNQIMFQPQVAPRIAAPALKSSTATCRINITDQDGTPLDTMSEDFQATLLIEY